ncbi:M20/M25/M40 family metallo-hydrolase [Microbacteriaceae bacterium 4G12]
MTDAEPTPRTPTDDPEVTELARRLIAIDSVNPDLVPGAAGETEIADFCAGWLADRGFEVTRLEATPGRPSIVGRRPGTGGGRTILLNGHLDTVGVSGYEGDPFGASVEDGLLNGRGAFDMKGGLAALLVAAARAADTGLRGGVLVALVADEEFGSIGTEEVLSAFTADGAVIAEPSNLEVTLAHRGFAWFEVEFTGKAAHGSMPEQGVDSIAHAARFLASVGVLAERLRSGDPHPILGHGSVRVSTIAGGVDAATVAPSCRLTVERRTLPGETADGVEAGLRALLDDLVEADPAVAYRLTRLVARAAFEAPLTSPLVEIVLAETERALGRPAVTRGEPFWTDAGLFAEAGIPTLLVGVDGVGAHATREVATVESLARLATLLEGSVREFCR